jgi:hypothetical protein
VLVVAVGVETVEHLSQELPGRLILVVAVEVLALRPLLEQVKMVEETEDLVLLF